MEIKPIKPNKFEFIFEGSAEALRLKKLVAPNMGRIARIGLSANIAVSKAAELLDVEKHPVSVVLEENEALNVTATVGERVIEIRAFDPANTPSERVSKQAEFQEIQAFRHNIWDIYKNRPQQ